MGASGAWSPVSLAPPCDLPVENAICAMLLRGEITPERLQPLEARHYFSTLHQEVHEAAVAAAARGDVVELQGIALELERRGLVGDFREHLEEIRASAPLLTERRLQAHRYRIIELWKRRQLLDVLLRTEAALRLGDLDARAARDRLEGCFRRLEGA
jgi:replicative DNA helicase